MSSDDIRLVEGFPDAQTFCRMRVEAGLSPKTLAAAQRGLSNTLYGVSLLRGGEVVGMGRIIGDNGTVFMVADIAVAPALQGRGQGKRILAALDAWLQVNAPESAYITLVADGDAKYLYAQFGFAETAPYSISMSYVMGAHGERLTGIA